MWHRAMREIAGSAAIADTLATDEQIWLDVSGSWVVTKWLRLYGHVRNLTGAQNIVGRRPYGARVSAPTWMQLGFRASF